MEEPITEKAKKIQINTQLDDDVAEAFDRYLRRSGVGTVAAATRALIVPQLRQLGYLPEEPMTELESATCS